MIYDREMSRTRLVLSLRVILSIGGRFNFSASNPEIPLNKFGYYKEEVVSSYLTHYNY